jgi:hypothetical protein
MIIANLKYYHDLAFEDYLQLPGVSFSSLKGEIPQSAGMMLGTRVHNYLNEPDKYDWQQVEEVKAIAGALRGVLGDSFNYMQKEIAFTCDMIHNGMVMKYKGRADALKPGRIVVDFKVLSGPLNSACERFGYPDQLSGYAFPNLCTRALIVAYNKKLKVPELKLINGDMIEKSIYSFWAYQVVSLGVPHKKLQYEG